jgi:hypothetical protein
LSEAVKLEGVEGWGMAQLAVPGRGVLDHRRHASGLPSRPVLKARAS